MDAGVFTDWSAAAPALTARCTGTTAMGRSPTLWAGRVSTSRRVVSGARRSTATTDSHVDVDQTALGSNRLFKGQGAGTFGDATDEGGTGVPGFPTSARYPWR